MQYDTIISRLDIITQEMRDMRDLVNFVNLKYDDVNDKLTKTMEENIEIKKENKKLNEKLLAINKVVHQLEYANISKQILIRGDYEILKNVDDIAGKTLDAAKAINVNISAQDIVNINILRKYKVKSKNGNEHDKTLAKIEFSTSIIKTNFMQKKKILKDLPSYKYFHFFDALTSETNKLFNYSKKLKTIGYAAVYVLLGKVFVKINNSSKPILIQNEATVDTLLANGRQKDLLTDTEILNQNKTNPNETHNNV